MSHFNLKRCFVITLSIVMLAGIGVFYFSQEAQAEGPGQAPAQTVKRAPQNKNFVDSRYKHNRSYPTRGQHVRALPGGSRTVMFNHTPYYFANGVWYRPYGGRYAVIAPPIGLFVPFLPPLYATIWIAGIPYYYANEVYYTQTAEGYVVAEPPQGEVIETPPDTQQGTESTENKIFIYPRKGQSEKQQATDRYECHTWAVGQTNYDPTKISSGIPANQIMQKRSDYQRAMASCLDARGYSAK